MYEDSIIDLTIVEIICDRDGGHTRINTNTVQIIIKDPYKIAPLIIMGLIIKISFYYLFPHHINIISLIIISSSIFNY